MNTRYLLPLALVAGSGLLANIAQAEVGNLSLTSVTSSFRLSLLGGDPR